ncbi:hypothetical protein [Clostridium sp. 1xD42-85]|uniref:hypothetical protein n=1 Tax=Clostridia TaxID=186801 RepID=UPI00336A1A87
MEGYRTTICVPYTVNANAPRVIENFLDISHLMFVYSGLLGDEEHAKVQNYDVNFIDGRFITSKIPIYQPNPDGRSVGGIMIMCMKFLIRRRLALRSRLQDPKKNLSY